MRNLEKFDLAALAKIDGGRIGIAFEQALRRVVQDCDDRPGEKKERTITLTMAVKPVLDEDGMCEDVNAQMAVTDNVPKRKSKIYNMSMRKGGHLLFAADSLDDHTQETLDFGSPEESY